LYIDGTANIDSLAVDLITTSVTFTGTPINFNSAVLNIGDAITDSIVFNARAGSNFIPLVDNSYDLGISGTEWKDLYIDGTAFIDSLDVNLITTSVTFTGTPINFNSTVVNFGDSSTDEAIFLGKMRVPVDSDATRGTAGTAGRIVFNTDDGQLNIDDGTNWTLPDGTTT